jgi:hypothetical protein
MAGVAREARCDLNGCDLDTTTMKLAILDIYVEDFVWRASNLMAIF